jgi:hypothetical protein
MAWRWGSSGKTPALQAQSPEFKPQSHQKKKKLLSMDRLKNTYSFLVQQ